MSGRLARLALAFISLAVLASGATDGALANTSARKSPGAHTACTKHAHAHAGSARARELASSRARRCRLRAQKRARKRAHHRELAASRRRAERVKRERSHHHATHPRTTRSVVSDAAGCEGATLEPDAANLDEVLAATLCLINREREHGGETALKEDADLQHAAQGHSESMSAQGYFEHVSPGGQTPLDRMRAVGYIDSGTAAYEIGENIAWGSFDDSTPEAIVSAWMHSPGHRANILNAGFRDSGIGISPNLPASFGGDGPGAIYTQDFGAR